MNDSPSPHTPTAAVADYLCATILGLIFVSCLVFIVELFLDSHVLKWQLPVIAGLCVPFFCLRFLKGQCNSIRFIAIALFLLGMVKAFFIAGLFYDTTSDSSAYHADAILQILNGVNPIHEWMHGFDDVWVNHYPKITWYFASIVIELTGNYGLGKIYNLLLIYAVAAYVFSYLKARNFHSGTALLMALAAAVNPVSIYQLHSFYVDGALASLTTLVVFSALAILWGPRTIDKAVFVMASCLLINIKFTGAATLFLVGAIGTLVFAWKWKQERNEAYIQQTKNWLTTLILIGLVGGILMGFNPYISNIIEEGNPLYPLTGKIKYDVVPAQSPQSFNDNHTSTMGKVVISVFSRTKNMVYQHGTAEPEFKVPFSVQPEELELYAYNDVRIGAWGVLFSGIICSAALLFLLSRGWKDTSVLVGLAFILATILINPGSWWARYAPQIALIPLLMALPALQSTVSWQRICAKFICALLILNSALIIKPNTEYFLHVTRDLDKQLDQVIASCGKGVYDISGSEGYHFEPILEHRGITIRYADKDIAAHYPAADVFVIKSDFMPIKQFFLHKEGCSGHGIVSDVNMH